jgi:TetR/AcrR family transcriptional repressor of nem operon
MPRPGVREQLVEAALDRFHALGYNGCGVQEITDAAGVPKGSFYNHFKSKEAMLCEVIERYCADSRVEMLEDTSTPPLERLRKHFEYLAKPYPRNGYERGCLLGNLSAEMMDASSEVREAVDGALKRWSDAVAAVLQEAQAEGQLRPELRPKVLGRFIVSSWEGALLRMKAAKSHGPLDDFFSVTFGVLLARD